MRTSGLSGQIKDALLFTVQYSFKLKHEKTFAVLLNMFHRPVLLTPNIYGDLNYESHEEHMVGYTQ